MKTTSKSKLRIGHNQLRQACRRD